jgi:hypothetical protein
VADVQQGSWPVVFRAGCQTTNYQRSQLNMWELLQALGRVLSSRRAGIDAPLANSAHASTADTDTPTHRQNKVINVNNIFEGDNGDKMMQQ